ncbi:hypothetical protein [Sediminicola sp. 1XM1-17]|uniref:hypothetical protein n=1 Tax=Sediminicola sp. 1XM1-17 TaxID=3127702 RepID=UPI003077F35F
MELKEYKQKSHNYTEKASEIARNLNFAGIGIIWVVKTTFPELKLSDFQLLFPLILITISLILDFLQYLIGGIIWIAFYKSKEKVGVAKTADVKSPEWRNRVLYGFYYLKIASIFFAYIFIVITLFNYF